MYSNRRKGRYQMGFRNEYADAEFGFELEAETFFSPEDEAHEDEFGVTFGDGRRCPHHPHVVTSSPDGMFDGLCGECEYELDFYASRAEVFETLKVKCEWYLSGTAPTCSKADGLPCLTAEGWETYCNEVQEAALADEEIPF